MVIPTSSAMVGVLDFAISLGVLFVLMAVFHVPPSFRLLGIPLFGLFAFFGALGVGLWLSALNVEFRDVRYIIPFLVQFWFFVTPVIYPAELVQSPIKRLLLGLNPMSGVVEGFRWCVLGGPRPGAMLGVSLATIVLLLVSGAFYFRRMEKQFADIV
jgi:lipopolysaccharide transport system permease protein